MTPTLPLPALSAFKAAFDPILSETLAALAAESAARTNDAGVLALLERARALGETGGKRVRPFVAYLAYASSGGTDERILRPLTALEIFHLFALAHDDLIDRGAVRHGLSTLHELAKERLPAGPSSVRVADGLALLAGDLVFSWSMRTLRRELSALVSAEVAERAHGVFDAMVDAVVLGQMLDVAMMAAPDAEAPAIMEKTLLKTADYTFVAPLKLGIALADAVPADEWCESFGGALGLAYQLQDDLLDIQGSADSLGKRPLGDVREGQHTLYTAYLRANGSEGEKAALETCFGKEDSDEGALARVRDAFVSSGAVAYGEARIADELAIAEGLVHGSPFSDDGRSALRALIARMRGRPA